MDLIKTTQTSTRNKKYVTQSREPDILQTFIENGSCKGSNGNTMRVHISRQTFPTPGIQDALRIGNTRRVLLRGQHS